MPSLMACTHTRTDPASRFRVLQYIPHLEKAGWKVSHRPNIPPRPWNSGLRPRILDAMAQRAGAALRRLSRLKDIRDSGRFDAVLVNRDLLGGKVEYEELLVRRNPRVLFDFDDAIFLGQKASHIGWVCKNAAWVTAGNELLAEFARRFTSRVTVLPTVVEVEGYKIGGHECRRGPVRVGWCGSDRSIAETLFPYIRMFARLQEALGFSFVIVTRPKPVLPACGLRWDFVEWSGDAEARLADCIDIGVMPLLDTEYQRGKCGLKILQYMASGLPAVASPVGVNCRLIEHGRRGYLASTEEDWLRAIQTLTGNPRLRREHGLAGRRYVEQAYSLRCWLPVLLDILECVARDTAVFRA